MLLPLQGCSLRTRFCRLHTSVCHCVSLSPGEMRWDRGRQPETTSRIRKYQQTLEVRLVPIEVSAGRRWSGLNSHPAHRLVGPGGPPAPAYAVCSPSTTVHPVAEETLWIHSLSTKYHSIAIYTTFSENTEPFL